MTQVHVLRTSYYMHYMYAQLYKAIKLLCYKSWHLLEPKELQKTSSTIMIISWIKWLCSSSNIYRPDRLTYKVYPHKGVHKPVEVSCPFLPFCLLFCTVVYGVETFSVSVGVFFCFCITDIHTHVKWQTKTLNYENSTNIPTYFFNTLEPTENGSHSADDIWGCICWSKIIDLNITEFRSWGPDWQ